MTFIETHRNSLIVGVTSLLIGGGIGYAIGCELTKREFQHSLLDFLKQQVMAEARKPQKGGSVIKSFEEMRAEEAAEAARRK